MGAGYVRIALTIMVLVALGASPGQAELYETPVLVTTIDDLRDLLETGELDDDAFDRLSQLIDRPLNLNTASIDALYDLPGLSYAMVKRIVRYREEREPFVDASDLVAVGVSRSVIAQLRPFVYVTDAKPDRAVVPIKGVARAQSVALLAPDAMPAMALRLKTDIMELVEIGVATVAQDRVGPLSFHQDHGLTWYSAETRSLRFRVSKFYVMADQPRWQAIAGTYRIGFAERLVFDETGRLRPEGIYPDLNDDTTGMVTECSAEELIEDDGTLRCGARFGVQERLMGAAARLKHYPVGQGTLDASLWVSWWPYDINQNAVDSVARDTDNPAGDDSRYLPSGFANPLYCVEGGPGYEEGCATDGQGKFASSAMRAAYSELILGGRVAYAPIPQLQIGTTAYYAMVDWLVSDDLYFAPSAQMPDRERFGTFGVDVLSRFANVTLSGEYARTFEGQNAALLRGMVGWKGVDLEAHARYYDREFDNPHARGTAHADTFKGQRDRDEVGGGVKLTAYPTDWFLGRLRVDAWHRPSLDVTNLRIDGRFNFEVLDWLAVTAGVDYTDYDLTRGGRDEEIVDDISTHWDEEVGVYMRDPRAGARLSAWAQLRFDIDRWARIRLRYRTTLYDKTLTSDPELASYYDQHFAQDHDAYLEGIAWVHRALTVSLRLHYSDDEVPYMDRGEAFLDTWAQLRWKIIAPLTLQVRYRLRAYVDERPTGNDGLVHILNTQLIARF